jgi:hypothetical protein
MERTMNGYPVILCGDHAAFEAEHANTPPEQRPDWPLPSFDAQDWAKAFCKIAAMHGYKDPAGNPIDEGWMVTWFANALMRGYDERTVEVMNLKHGIRWACGEVPDGDDKWFGDVGAEQQEGKRPKPYWWRSHLRAVSGIDKTAT